MGWHFFLQGIFLTQGLNPCPVCLLHWQVDSLPLCHLGSPCVYSFPVNRFISTIFLDSAYICISIGCLFFCFWLTSFLVHLPQFNWFKIAPVFSWVIVHRNSWGRRAKHNWATENSAHSKHLLITDSTFLSTKGPHGPHEGATVSFKDPIKGALFFTRLSGCLMALCPMSC